MSENLNKDVREMKDKDGNYVRVLICEFYDTWNRKRIILTNNCILCEGKKLP